MEQTTKIDPGAVRYGDFINYYTFNTVEERISKINSLPDSIWKFQNNPCLDIGCNSGNLTHALYSFLKTKIKEDVEIVVLGIDINENLIKSAESLIKDNSNLIFKCIDIMKPNQSEFIYSFLKNYNRTQFDIVFCLSVTMWIHLNHSDDGLKKFLQITSNMSNLLVTENQPWKCYKNAVRRMKRADQSSFPNFSKLKWRHNIENDIDNYLQNNLKKKKLHITNSTKWDRKICLYN